MRLQTSAIVNTVFFSFFLTMFIWSHIMAAITKGGFAPKNKTKLIEEKIPQDSQFYSIIREREEIYHEVVVNRKLRQRRQSVSITDNELLLDG